MEKFRKGDESWKQFVLRYFDVDDLWEIVGKIKMGWI